MVALTKADIPDSINTVEKLEVWCATLLQHLHPSLTVVEASGGSDRAAVSQCYFITADATPKWRNISRMSIEVDANWQRGGKLWTFAKELSTSAIPTEFKS